MKKSLIVPINFLILLLSFNATLSAVTVKFKVDMSNETVSTNGVHIAGSFQGWDPAKTQAIHEGDNIYSATITDLSAGESVEYKFINGNAWGEDEFGGGGANRKYTIPSSDDSTYAFCFNALYLCSESEVTFQVDMQEETVSSKGIHVAGNFGDHTTTASYANWDPSSIALSDENADLVYDVKLILKQGSTVEYKFINGDAWGEDEFGGGGANRTFTVPSTMTHTIPAPCFNSLTSCAVEILSVSIDPNFKLKSGASVTDVRFKGAMTGWALFQAYDDGTNGDVTAGDGIWSAKLPDTVSAGTNIEWGAIDTDNGDGTNCSSCDGSDGWGDWLLSYMPASDGGANRKITIDANRKITGQHTFHLAPQAEPVTAFAYFKVDMRAYERLGFYSKERHDSLQVRGGFNSWAGTVMNRVPGSTIHEATVEITDIPGKIDKYKYYLNLNQESFNLLAAQTPDLNEDDYGTNVTDGWFYENPPKYGGGDRPFTFEGDPAKTQELGLEYYNGIPPAGVIPEGHSIEATFSVDMRDAFGLAVPFDASTDSVWFIWKDKWNEALNGYYNYHPDMLLNDNGEDGDATAGDSIYTVTFDIAGPCVMSLVYVYEYKSPEKAVQEGGGFASGRYRVRYITPTNASAGVFPTKYTADDKYQKEPPLPVEDLPESSLAIGDESGSIPNGFKLEQNYPNPFNPTTEIKFMIPEATDVLFSVYNIQGQQIVTYKQNFPAAGHYGFRWNGKNMKGISVPSGVYFYEVKTSTHHAVKKMTLLK